MIVDIDINALDFGPGASEPDDVAGDFLELFFDAIPNVVERQLPRKEVECCNQAR